MKSISTHKKRKSNRKNSRKIYRDPDLVILPKNFGTSKATANEESGNVIKAAGIQFENIVISETTKGTEGEIKVIAEIGVWDCYEKRIKSTVVYRNILLTGMHPYPSNRLIIGEVLPTEKDAKWLANFKRSDGIYYLDLASGSRTHGRFTYNSKTVGKKYYGEDWKRIIYGSIIHTGCQRLRYRTIKFVVTDDTLRDEYGNFRDDPVGNYHWFTGDSHAKASADLMAFLGLPLETTEDDYYDYEIAQQFRMAGFEKWVGKGTLAWNPDLDDSPYQLAIPISSMKGNKLPLGVHEGKLLMGLVFESEERFGKTGWMLWQWFKFETMEKDGIIERMKAKCFELNQAWNNIQKLAEVLKLTKSEAEIEIDTEETITEAEYISMVTRIIQADVQGILLLHPYVVQRIKWALQERWINLAKNAGVRFNSLMTQPDESLRHYYAVQTDGRIVGKKVFCAPDFREGKYILFINPMRHWGDVQIWENKHEGDYANTHGIMAAPTDLMLTLGRDFDGDWVQLSSVNKYPNIVEEIESFTDAPTVEKLPKVAKTGSIFQIAINSMQDLTGVVASLIAKCRSVGAENIVLNIPPGGEQKEYKEMRIIDFLSQELQIAVDSIKSAYPNNTNGLDLVTSTLEELGGDAPWLQDFKTKECYYSRKCLVVEDAEDTVSRLVKLVNSYWRAPDLGNPLSPKNFINILFDGVSYSQEQLNYAYQIRSQYWADMKAASEWKDANGGDSTKTREVTAVYRTKVPDIYAMKDSNGNLYEPTSWVAAFWYASHDVNSGQGGMVFTMFPDEIIEQLGKKAEVKIDTFEVYGVQNTEWVKNTVSLDDWNGQLVNVRVVQKTINGKNQIAVEMEVIGQEALGWKVLGIVAEKDRGKVVLGSSQTMKIYTSAYRKTETARVKLFSTDMSYKDIDNHLFYSIDHNTGFPK